MGNPDLQGLVKLWSTGQRVINVQRPALSKDISVMTRLHLQKVSGLAARACGPSTCLHTTLPHDCFLCNEGLFVAMRVCDMPLARSALQLGNCASHTHTQMHK